MSHLPFATVSIETSFGIAKEKRYFYWRPKPSIPEGDNDPWYSSTPICHNKLDRMLKEILMKAGLSSEHKSNHCLRATSISRKYRQAIPEKMIMERSGHLSKEGVRSYERMSSEQVRSLCETLATGIPLDMPFLTMVESVNVAEVSFDHHFEKSCQMLANSNTGTVPNAMPSAYESMGSTALDSSIKENVDPANLEKVKDTFKQLNFQSVRDCTLNFTFSFSN